jgi:hypothetical protein
VTIVVTADHVPIALPRSFSSIDDEISDKLPGIINAPPIPCTILKATKNVMPGAIPQAAEPAMKIIIPAMNIFFRPSLSPKDPPMRIKDASIS